MAARYSAVSANPSVWSSDTVEGVDRASDTGIHYFGMPPSPQAVEADQGPHYTQSHQKLRYK